MFVAEDMYQLGSQRSAIRELFEYGKQRAAVVGAENVYDFSLGNPTVPAPDCVNETIRDLTQKLDSISLHGYTSAQGDIETRQAIADYLNKTYETAFSADNFYLTMGAAASLSVCFRALTTSPEDEFITIAPFFPEYRVFVEANGAKLVVVPPHTSDFQIDFEALEKDFQVGKGKDGAVFLLLRQFDCLLIGFQCRKKLQSFPIESSLSKELSGGDNLFLFGRRTGGEKANEKEYLYIVYHLNPSFEGVKIIIFLSVYPLEQVL